MPIVGYNIKDKVNLVNYPIELDLPLAFEYGSISLSLNFEDHPTGSISIDKIPETEIEAYRFAYNTRGKQITLFQTSKEPIFLTISGYAEVENIIYIENDIREVKVFKININLEGGHRNTVETNHYVRLPSKLLGSGTNLSVSKSNIPSTIFKSQLINRYNAVTNIPSSFSEIGVNNDGSLLSASTTLQSYVKNGYLDLKDLAKVAGVQYEGFTYPISIPSQEDDNSFNLNFANAILPQLRLNRAILDYNGPTIRTKPFDGGKVWPITKNDIQYEIEISRQEPYEFKNTQLTGKDGEPFLSSTQKRDLLIEDLVGEEQERKNPNKLVLDEGDVNPTVKPADVTRITSLDMNFDSSGPRKTLKRTTTLNGQPFEEEIFIYGFAYTAQQIRNYNAETASASVDDPPLLSTLPQSWWTQIEYQKTTYIYEEANVSIRLRVKDEKTKQLLPVTYLSSGGTRNNFESKYLTTIKTTGWKLGRFQQESANSDTDSRIIYDTLEDDSSLTASEVTYFREQERSITFRRIPFSSTTQYKLAPKDDYYDNSSGVPFQTQKVDRKDLNLGGTGKVIAAVPDPTYQYPMVILQETTLGQAFSSMDHPENVFIREERNAILDDNTLSAADKAEQLKELKLLPELSFGEDTYEIKIRKVLPSKNTTSLVGKDQKVETDIYQEFEQRASSQDTNFQYSLLNILFRTTASTLPEATTFNYEYETKDEEEKDDNDPRNYEYRLWTTNDPTIKGVDSISYETRDLEKALRAAETDYVINNFLNSYEENINLAWFYPEVRPGDYFEFQDDLSRGRRKVKSCTIQVDFNGYVNEELIKTSPGANFVVGKYEEAPTINYEKRKPNDTDSELDIQTRVSGSELLGGSIFPRIRTRRNRNGDAIDE